MAEATGTEITNTNTGILSRISGIFSNVKKLRSDPAVQKSVPLDEDDMGLSDAQRISTAPLPL